MKFSLQFIKPKIGLQISFILQKGAMKMIYIANDVNVLKKVIMSYRPVHLHCNISEKTKVSVMFFVLIQCIHYFIMKNVNKVQYDK